MTRAELLSLFAPALNEAAGSLDFPEILADIRTVEAFVNYDDQETLVLEDA